MRYGIIDIGSNTFRLIIAEITEKSYFVIDGFKENVRLSEGLDKDSFLIEEKMEYGKKTLGMLVDYCRASKCEEIRIVATAALRKARNRDEFINYAKEEIGVDVELLSGESEAMYDYIGSINSLSKNNYIFMDIGGGSTEIGLVKDRKLINSISLSFGAVDLANTFNLRDKPKDDDLKKLEEYIEDKYKEVSWLDEGKNLPLIGIGGTIRTIGKIQKRKDNYPLSAIHNYYIDTKDVDELFEQVSLIGRKKRETISGLGKDRSDIFVGACGAVKHLLDHCGSSQLVISRDGLREGLMFEKCGFGFDNIKKNPLRLSVENMMMIYKVDIEHAAHVHFLMIRLFEELKDIHDIKDDMSDIIYASSMLHDVGKLLDYKNHHKHTFYIMLNSMFKGMSNKRQLISAIIAGRHTTHKLKVDLEEYYKILTVEEKEKIEKLSVLLMMAEGLDRSNSMRIKDIKCEKHKDTVIIETFSDEDITLEKAYMKFFENIFHSTFGLYIVVV
jgi:exopolyphosphatase/guanosine-5'-triphosphate,3'-diphosphate pyrophosphatase